MPTSIVVRAALVAFCLSLTVPASRLAAQSLANVRAQLHVTDSAHLEILTLRDGSTLVGKIMTIAADTLTFESSAGTFSLAIASVSGVREVGVDRMKDGEYWFPNPNETRLFFAPSARMLPRGDGYVSDYEVFFPGVAYGLTDNISIGGGASLLPTGLNNQAFYFTPKIGGAVHENVDLAVGALIVGGIPDESTVGIVYGVGTFGPPDASITAGLGYGFAGTTIARNPVAMIGGELRVAKHIGLVTENYIIPNTHANPLYSYGVRLMGEKMTVDLALFNISGSNSGLGFPFVDFVFKF
ncbi:MAG: hypothetical protein ABI408_08690 [Gemmatimonadaceae bacterium]